MKKSDLIFAAVLLPLDFFMLIAAGIAAYFLRFQTLVDIRPILYTIPFSRYFVIVCIVSLVSLLFFALNGLYTIDHYRIRHEISKILTATSTSIMAVIIFIFFIQELFNSRFIVLAGWILAIVCVSTARIFLRLIKLLLFSYTIGSDKIAVIGSTKQAKSFINFIKKHRTLGYEVCAQSENASEEFKKTLQEMRKKNLLDELFIIDKNLTRDELQSIIQFAHASHIPVLYMADSIGSQFFQFSTIAGIPFLEVRRTRLEGWGRILKRTSDIFLSILLFILTLPIMCIVAICIKLESKGPIIYINERVGQNGKIFFVYKFRSMYIQDCIGSKYDPTGNAARYQEKLIKEKSERIGPVYKVLNDPRRTKVGRCIERFSIDELPQLCNVLKGEMSLVGPRPHMSIEVAGYQKRHRQLFVIKPGITGMAQIEGRSDLDFEDEAKLDLYYIEHWNLWLDLIIILKTPFVILTRKSRV